MKIPTISQKVMDWFLANTDINVKDESKVRESRNGYLISFDPTPVIINMETGDQIDYTNFTPEDYFNGLESAKEIKFQEVGGHILNVDLNSLPAGENYPKGTTIQLQALDPATRESMISFAEHCMLQLLRKPGTMKKPPYVTSGDKIKVSRILRPYQDETRFIPLKKSPEQMKNYLSSELRNMVSELELGTLTEEGLYAYFRGFMEGTNVDSRITVDVLEQFGELGKEQAVAIKVTEGW